ncbi:MAG: hypothetical protein PHN37_03205 [Candidatus Pacebacteria bacterium]|nr:hypothetical protein [Candidatus Paceibacterota bacterium]
MKNLSKLLFFIIFLILILSTSLSASGQSYNYREVWNSWTDYQRYIYLWGFQDAREFICYDICDIIQEFLGSEQLSIYELVKIINLTNKIDLLEINANIVDYEELNLSIDTDSPDLKAIRDVMTDLYKDPANTYISFEKMIFFAIDKLSGESIENRLEEERKSIKESEKKYQELLKK